MVDTNNSNSSLLQSNLNSILHWPLARKIELLSSFSQCSIPLCLCPGWIKPLESNLNDVTIIDETTSIRKPLLCSSCQHPHDVHYNENTKEKYWSMDSTLDQVDSALQTLLDADLLIRFATSTSLSDQHDLSTNRILLFVAQTLQSTITTMAIHTTRQDLIRTNLINLLGSSPFEQPSIRDAVINFICSISSSDHQQIHTTFEAGKQFLQYLNTWKMPSDVAHHLWLQQQAESTSSQVKTPKNYELWYARWVAHCIIPQLCPKSLTKYDPVSIFGLEYLSIIFDHFKSDIFSSHSPTSILVRFFDTFHQTLFEKDSVIWSTSYERPVIPILEGEIDQILNNESNSNSTSNNVSIEPTTEKKITRRVSKALTNKKQVKRLESNHRRISTSSAQSNANASTTSSSSSTPSDSDLINRIWSTVCERHEQRLQAEIEKTLFKANPKRDEVARLAEQRGFAEFHLIKHDLNKTGNEETDLMYKRLLQLINVFSRALPKMPQTYIARTVLDPRHQSLVIVFASKVIGGICFRMFPHRSVK